MWARACWLWLCWHAGARLCVWACTINPLVLAEGPWEMQVYIVYSNFSIGTSKSSPSCVSSTLNHRSFHRSAWPSISLPQPVHSAALYSYFPALLENPFQLILSVGSVWYFGILLRMKCCHLVSGIIWAAGRYRSSVSLSLKQQNMDIQHLLMLSLMLLWLHLRQVQDNLISK